MKDNQAENKNISSDYKVSLFLGQELDPVFYERYQRYRELNSHRHARDPLAFSYEGYVFSLCTQSNHLHWLDRGETFGDAELAEHFAQQLLVELGYYSDDELDADSVATDYECMPSTGLKLEM